MIERARSRGVLIALEGVDGAGKSVQAERLRGILTDHGHPACVLPEPGGTALGQQLRDVLLAAQQPVQDAFVETMLFMASRRQLVIERIEPALERGETVILDRSFLSTWVYQGVVGGVDLDLCRQLSRNAHGSAWPDRILLLDLEPAEALARRAMRGEADGFEARGADYLAAVVAGFRSAAALEPDLVHRIDAAGPVEAVTARCVAALGGLVPA